MSKIKTTLDRINGRLDITAEKISELVDIAIKTQNKSEKEIRSKYQEKTNKQTNKASMSCGMTIHVILVPKGEEGRDRKKI